MAPRKPPPAPGLLAPAVPSKAQMEAVDRLVWDNVHAVEALEAPALRALLPVLKQVRDELERDLAQWLATARDGADRFTAQRLRVALRQVQASIDAATRLEPVLAAAFKLGRHSTGALAAASLHTEIARFGSLFGESIRPVQLDTAAVIARGDRLLWKHHKISAARYGGQIGDDIRHQLAVGVARGETFAELKARLVKHGGPRGMVALQGRLGDPHAVAEHIAEGLFKRYRFWAERLVRTELMHAYNLQHQAGIGLLNQNLDAGQEPYVRLWDAAADRRVCPICRGLDGKTAPLDGPFVGGYDHPPAHPNCRCVEVAWHASWGSIPGERAARGPIPSVLPDGFGRGPASPRAKVISGVPTRGRLREGAIYNLDPSLIADRLVQLDAGMQQARRTRIAAGWAKGVKLDPVKLAIRRDGKIEVVDGRHRLAEAISQGRRIAARFVRGV